MRRSLPPSVLSGKRCMLQQKRPCHPRVTVGLLMRPWSCAATQSCLLLVAQHLLSNNGLCCSLDPCLPVQVGPCVEVVLLVQAAVVMIVAKLKLQSVACLCTSMCNLTLATVTRCAGPIDPGACRELQHMPVGLQDPCSTAV